MIGKKHGKGTIIYKDGTVINEEYKNGKKEGNIL